MAGGTDKAHETSQGRDDGVSMCIDVRDREGVLVRAIPFTADADPLTCRRFRCHYSGRLRELVDLDAVADRAGTDPARIRADIEQFDDQTAMHARYGRSLAAPDEFDLGRVHAAVARFARLVAHFPIVTSWDPPPAAFADPIVATRTHRRLPKADSGYPRCRDPIDFWKPPITDIREFATDSDALEDALLRDHPPEGWLSHEVRCAYRICAFAAMLCPTDGMVRDLLRQAERTVRTYGPRLARLAFTRRREELVGLLSRTGRYIPSENPVPGIDADQEEFVRERNACRIAFDDGLVPIDFQIDPSCIWTMAWLHGRGRPRTMLSCVWLDDEEPDGHARPVRPALHPAV